MKLTKFTVTEAAMRPAKPGVRECFYCGQPVGEQHAVGCVLVNKRVKLRAVIEYEDHVPAHWDRHQIEFYFNEGSWCADNLLEQLENQGEGCLCGQTEIHCEDANGSEHFLEE